MALTEYELVLLDDGEIVLQRSGSSEPLVTISFSEPVMQYLEDKHVDVAKVMIDAGIKAAVNINDGENVTKTVNFDPKQHSIH